jgi:FAD:protein FMN transferase
MRRTQFFNTAVLGCVVGFIAPLLACSTKAPPPQTEFVMGTVCTVNLFDRGNPETYRKIFARLKEIEDRMSINKGGTDLDAVNANSGIAPVVVHEDVARVVAEAKRFAELSGGAFDPTIGPIVKLWNIGTDDARVPSPSEIKAALPLVGWHDLEVDEATHSVFLKRKGMVIDLGAIAKGYAADEVAKIIQAHRIPRAIIDLGGNVLAYGTKKGGDAWRIGVQDPSAQRGEPIGVVQVKNKTMVTSGVYERFLEVDGVRYHHILSTTDGYPVRNGLLSVTIIADKSIEADGLSTSVFALGFEKGKALVESLDGVEAIFIFDDLTVRATKGIKKDFEITDPKYRLIE